MWSTRGLLKPSFADLWGVNKLTLLADVRAMREAL